MSCRCVCRVLVFVFVFMSCVSVVPLENGWERDLCVCCWCSVLRWLIAFQCENHRDRYHHPIILSSYHHHSQHNHKNRNYSNVPWDASLAHDVMFCCDVYEPPCYQQPVCLSIVTGVLLCIPRFRAMALSWLMFYWTSQPSVLLPFIFCSLSVLFLSSLFMFDFLHNIRLVVFYIVQ